MTRTVETDGSPRKRVLVVDDDKPVRGLVRALLRRENVEIDECDGGDEALLLLDRNHYHVVILDLEMPRGSGLAVLERLKSRGQPCAIVMSAGTRKTLDALNAECIYVVFQKPFDITSMLEAVRSCLG